MSAEGFAPYFDRAACTVRRALVARAVLDGLSVGALGGVVVAGAFWALGRHGGPVAGALLAVGGAVVGAIIEAGRRWSDQDVALFLDARLTRTESISTALEAGTWDDEVAREIDGAATRALAARDGERIRPAVLHRAHAALPIALALLLGIHRLPTRAVHEGAGHVVATTDDTVRRSLDGLRRVEALRDVETAGPEERRRLDALAASAQKLDEQAKHGVDRKSALDALAKLRDGVEAERTRLASAKNRAGLDAAVQRLSRTAETRDAAMALSNADPVAFDRAMAQVAKLAEAASRASAATALSDAARAAHEREAEEVARAIDEQQHLLQRRAEQSHAMQEVTRLLEQALPAEQRRGLERLGRANAGNQDAMAEAMAQALEGLSDDERKRVAESLSHGAEGMQQEGAPTRGEVARLAKALSSKEGRDALREELRKLARVERGKLARNAETIAMARLGIDDAQRALSGEPSEGGRLGSRSDPTAPSVGNEKSGAASPGGSLGDHSGETPEVAGSAFVARAVAPTQGTGIYAGKAPGSAPPSTGLGEETTSPHALSIAAPREVGAVERSTVPREYRDQVRRYFAP